MKKRLAEKILGVTGKYGNWDSNYQPYSIPQQEKAIKALKLPESFREAILGYGIFYKIPVKYRKCDTAQFQIAQMMGMENEKPETVEYECTNTNSYGMKEYRDGCIQNCDECEYCQPIQ